MGRKNRQSGEQKQIIPYDVTDFSGSVIKGVAASKIPNSALAEAHDVIIYPDSIDGREGCVQFTDTTPPAMDDRTGYTATKTDYIITAAPGTFTEDDPSNYFVFPGDPDTRYEICEYISDEQVRTFLDGDHASTANCYIVGKTNFTKWNSIRRLWMFMFGQDFYYSEWKLETLNRIRVISRDLPYNANSTYQDFSEFASLIFNAAGMYRIDFGKNPALAYKINIPVPERTIQEVFESGSTKYKYHYVYSAARLTVDGVNVVNRLLPSRIEQETGTNAWDDDYKDYQEINTVEPLGDETNTYEKLICGNVDSPYNSISGWLALGTLGSFKISINGTTYYEIVCEFVDVATMADVAAIIEDALNDYFPKAKCVYVNDHFEISSGRIINGTVSYMTLGTVGTDISAILKGNSTDGTIESFYTTTPNVIGPLYLPEVKGTEPQEYQWHLTHLPVYRTKDLSNRYQIEDESDQLNNPNDLVWVADVRTCGAFFGYISGNYFIAEYGEFERFDKGSTLELDNGNRYEILEYVNSTIVQISSGYYNEVSDNHAACIGNGRVMRASQTGNVVTRTHGSSFSSSDLRKPIKWSTGYWSYIIEIISANQVRVADTMDKPVMGLTLDPVYRYFNDIVSDSELDARLTRLKLKQRYWKPMQNSNVGCVTPGLIFNAKRNNGTVHYGQIPDTLEYLHGFHDKGYQITDVIPDDIQAMYLFQDMLIIWTTKKTWRWPLSSYQFLTNPYTKDAILQITGLEIADEDKGCYDWGSIEPIGNGVIQLLTSEPGQVGWRTYNGYQYGENSLEVPGVGKDRIPEIQDMQQATSALYNGRIGLLLMGRA